MAKLYFRYGTMGSAKTLNLLAVAHNYRSQNKEVLLLKPALDVRFGKQIIQSRAGLEQEADILVTPGARLIPEILQGISCLLVDEAQFLEPNFVDHLHEIARDHDVPVICYGLRTDFRRKLFPASERLMELADSLEEVKNTCHYCNKKAIFNLRLREGEGVVEGPQIELGAEDKYQPVCAPCYRDKTAKARATVAPTTAAAVKTPATASSARSRKKSVEL